MGEEEEGDLVVVVVYNCVPLLTSLYYNTQWGSREKTTTTTTTCLCACYMLLLDTTDAESLMCAIRVCVCVCVYYLCARKQDWVFLNLTSFSSNTGRGVRVESELYFLGPAENRFGAYCVFRYIFPFFRVFCDVTHSCSLRLDGECILYLELNFSCCDR